MVVEIDGPCSWKVQQAQGDETVPPALHEDKVMTIKLVKTCAGRPEQYDAFIGDRQVGFLRLRHGLFTVYYPDGNGDEMYCSRTDGDGEFTNDERKYKLDYAVKVIQYWVNTGKRLPTGYYDFKEIKYELKDVSNSKPIDKTKKSYLLRMAVSGGLRWGTDNGGGEFNGVFENKYLHRLGEQEREFIIKMCDVMDAMEDDLANLVCSAGQT